MVVPVAIYLAINAGGTRRARLGRRRCRPTPRSRSALLALVGPRLPDRLRAFMLTVAVVDDLVALLVIAIVYSEHVDAVPLLDRGWRSSRVVLALRAPASAAALVYAVLGVAAWVALFKSGVDPVVVGLAMGLLTYAYPAARGDLERATELLPARSASSRRRSSPARRSVGARRRRSRRTSGCSSSTTRGRAT